MERLTGFNPRNGFSFIEGYATYLPGEVQMQLVQSVVDKCRQYEDAEEEGRLIILPCKVGDKVYRIQTIVGIDKHGKYIILRDPGVQEVRFDLLLLSEWGRRTFATPEEAEAALAEKEGDA